MAKSDLLVYATNLNSMGDQVLKYSKVNNDQDIPLYISKLKKAIELGKYIKVPKIVSVEHRELIVALDDYASTCDEIYQKSIEQELFSEVAEEYYKASQVEDRLIDVHKKLEPSINAYLFAKSK